MKRTFFSILVLTLLTVSSVIVSNDKISDSGCPCTGTPVTIEVCFPTSCPGLPPPDTRIALIDKDCNQTVANCVITSSNPCCVITTNACSNHTFYVTYNQGNGICTTATFVPSANPHTVTINCYCP